MLYQCPICKDFLKSEKALNIHLVFQHEAFESGDIKEQSIKSLEHMKDQIRLLLIKIPSTRSNDKILYQALLRYFYPHFMVYDPEDQLLKPPYGRIGWKFQEWMSFPSYESCRRLRQYWQSKAKANIKAGIGTRADAELLASDKVEEQRRLKEEAYKEYFIKA